MDSTDIVTGQDQSTAARSSKRARNSDDEDAESIEDIGAMDYTADTEEDDDDAENASVERREGGSGSTEGEDIRNFINLAEELKDLTVSSGNIWREELADTKGGEIGDLRQRNVEKRRSE